MVPIWMAVSTVPGPVGGLVLERAGEDSGQWATARSSVGVEGRAWRADATVPVAAVADPVGVRTGLGAPSLGIARVGDVSGGLQVTLPAGTREVSQRALGVTPWVGLSHPVGPLRIGGQVGLTWAPGADPVQLPTTDRASAQAHGGLAPLRPGGLPPAEHLHADPIHGKELHARMWAGAAMLDVRHSGAGSTLEAGLVLAGSPERTVRPLGMVAVPLISTGASGLHLEVGVEVRPVSSLAVRRTSVLPH